MIKKILLGALALGCFAVGAQVVVDVPIKQSDIDENGKVKLELNLNIEQPIVEVPVEPEQPPEEPEPEPEQPPAPPIEGQVLFDEDLAEEQPQSTPLNVHIPFGLQSPFDIEYKGAFRVTARGERASNGATGTLGYNAENNSIFLAGHSRYWSIAEFAIPNQLSYETSARNIVNAELLQDYAPVLPQKANHVVIGLLADKGVLTVTSEDWYDADNEYKTNIQAFNLNDITEPLAPARFLEGGSLTAGYMSAIPEDAQALLGGEFLVGWASNGSITSRYSQGPSLNTFLPIDAITNEVVNVDTKQVYPFPSHMMDSKGANHGEQPTSPVWTILSKGLYGFVVPNSNVFMVIGSSGGSHHGIGYKGTPNGFPNRVDGYYPFEWSDRYNYFWLFDINDIASNESHWESKPFSYGKWSHPYSGMVGGATFDHENNLLYISIKGAGKVGRYDNPPLIVSYKITAKDK